MMSEFKIYYERISDLYTLPKRIGAYVITHTTNNTHAEKYIGSTKNLYNRIHNHNKNIIYIDIYVTDDIDLAESLERVLIELTNPATNIQIPSLSYNDNELMKELLEVTNIKNHTLENTVRIGYRYLKYFNKKEKYNYTINLNCGIIRTEIKSLIETKWNRLITLRKEYLDEMNFKAGKYEVTYDKDEIRIKKIIKNDNSWRNHKVI